MIMYRITYGLMTSQPQLFFTQPLSVQEATPCATYHHTVGLTLTGAPFFHPGYAFGTSCRSMSSQRQPWRPSREGCPVTIRCNRGMLLLVFKLLLTRPQMHLVHIHSLPLLTHPMVGNQNGSFQRKYAFPVPFAGKNGSSRRKVIFWLRVCLNVRFYMLCRIFS